MYKYIENEKATVHTNAYHIPHSFNMSGSPLIDQITNLNMKAMQKFQNQ